MSSGPSDKIFISADSLLRDSVELGLRVVRSGFRPTFLVGIWRGGAPVGIAVQDEAPPVAALRDMVWDIHCDHSIESAHDRHDNSSYFAMLKFLPRSTDLNVFQRHFRQSPSPV